MITDSGTGDFFDYQNVQKCQVQIDDKFRELAECLKSANDYMNAHIDTAPNETAIKGVLGERFLEDWNINASTFSDFYENFSSWSSLMASIIEEYGTFEQEAVKNAIGKNQSTGVTLKGVAATRAAQQFNEGQWKAEQEYLEMIGESCDPTNFAKLGWEKVSVNAVGAYNNDDVNKTITNIANGETVYDSDGNAVNGLVLKPELVEDDYFNEFMIYEGIDKNGNKQYYSIETDGELKLLEKNYVKEVARVSDTLKVDDVYDIWEGFSGDDAHERIYKTSYKIGYNKSTDETYMALPRSDGTVEYYAVKGNIGTYNSNDKSNNTSGKITKVNLTPKQVSDAGFNPLYEDQTFETQDVEAIQNQYSGVQGVDANNNPTDKGYYSNGQFHDIPGGVPPEEDTQNSGTPYTGTVTPGPVPADDDDDEREI